MSRADRVAKNIAEISDLVDREDSLITDTTLPNAVISMAGMNAQIALLFAELVDEVSEIRRGLDELNKGIRNVERSIGKK